MLLLNQFFHPSSAPTSQLLTDLALHLADEGHRVTAICGRSEYNTANSTPLPNITVHRIPNLPFGHNKVTRILSYGSFYLGALAVALTTRKPQVIVTLTTPPLLSVIGTLIKKIRNTPHFIWEMDVYPDIAIELGVLSPRGPLTRIIGALANWSRRNADGIIALGDDMRDLLIARGIPAAKISVAENWADSAEIAPQPFPEGPLHLLYSGNLGLAHDIETLQGAMLALNKAGRFHFTFAGGGPRRKSLESFALGHKLSNIFFRGYCPRSELSQTLAQCHVGVVTQHPRVHGSVVPSKVYSILAAGRPIVYIGQVDTTPARIIRRFDCGWQIDPGDVDGLVGVLQRLEANRWLVHSAGQRARQAFLENYDREIGVRRIAAIVSPSRPGTTPSWLRRPQPSASLSDSSGADYVPHSAYRDEAITASQSPTCHTEDSSGPGIAFENTKVT